MTPQEKELLERFLADMAAARAAQKDPQAEALIREAVGRQPDAAYLLVQRAIQLDQALQLTQTEAQQLKDEVQKLRNELEHGNAAGKVAAPGGGFLSDPYAWGSPRKAAAPVATAPATAPGTAAGIPGTQATPTAAQPQPAARPAAGSGWGGSGMLGTVATTAAGVVAGSFLFQGIQNLMHRNDPPAAAAPEHTHSAEQHAPQSLAHEEDSTLDDSNDTFAAGDDGGSDYA
jgi:hypothetical protein